MNESQISCFLAVADSGSFAAAAETLFRAPQSVNRHILNLEAELEVRLFTRSSEGVALTPEGERYYRHFTMAGHRYRHMMESIRATGQNLALEFTVGYSTWIDPLGAVEAGVGAFRESHPDTRFTGMQYTNGELLQAMAEGSVDVAVMCDTQVFIRGDFEIVRFAQEHLRLYVPGQYHSETPDPDAWGLVMFDSPYGPWSGVQWREISRRLSGRHLGVSPRDIQIMPNIRSALCSVENHCGIVVCDTRFGYLAGAEGLHSYPVEMESHLACVWNKKNENPLIEAFACHMKDFYGTE